MKKLFIVLGIVAVIAGAVLYVVSNLDMIVERVIEHQGSAATQTPVRVAGVSIKLSEAQGTISSLTVGNPEGFPGYAIEMDNFSLNLDGSSLTSDVIVIENILVQGARINILQQANGNNIQELLRNLDATSSGDSDESEEGALRITCPHCEQHIEVPGDSVGEGIQCPGCEHELEIGERPALFDGFAFFGISKSYFVLSLKRTKILHL